MTETSAVSCSDHFWCYLRFCRLIQNGRPANERSPEEPDTQNQFSLSTRGPHRRDLPLSTKSSPQSTILGRDSKWPWVLLLTTMVKQQWLGVGWPCLTRFRHLVNICWVKYFGDGKLYDGEEDVYISICRVCMFSAFRDKRKKQGVQIPHPLPPTLCVWASEAEERVAEVAATEPQGSLRGSHL